VDPFNCFPDYFELEIETNIPTQKFMVMFFTEELKKDDNGQYYYSSEYPHKNLMQSFIGYKRYHDFVDYDPNEDYFSPE